MASATARLPEVPSSALQHSRAVAQVKRLCERYMADPEFRAQVAADIRLAELPAGVDLDPEEVRDAWDAEWHAMHPDAPLSVSTQAYRDFSRWRDGLREWFRGRSIPLDTRFAAWRERQIQRADGQLHGGTGRRLNHAPFTFELSTGCSVGCSFCAVSSGKLTGVFHYTEENAALWSEALQTAVDVCGPAAQFAFCYWATDPFDNPDYEKFCLDFEAIVDIFPTTTTALALQDPKRTRAFLRLAHDHECPSIRFSVPTVAAMKRIHETFTPEELLWVQCLPMNTGSLVVKTNAGRFRDRGHADPTVLEVEKKKLDEILRLSIADMNRDLLPLEALPETSACVTGFLVNMLERKVSLISPCPASDQWPHGHMVFDERRFADGRDFSRVVEAMIEAHMPASLPEDRPLRLRSDIRCETLDDGFSLVAPSRTLRFTNPGSTEYLRYLGAEVGRGELTRSALALSAYYSTGVPIETTLTTVDQMFTLGVFEEEPAT